MAKLFLRWILDTLASYLEYIVFYIIFPGGTIFNIASNFYYYTFDMFTNQRNKKIIDNKNINNDWENPLVIGRNRRNMFTYTMSFLNRKDLFIYWKKYSLYDDIKNNEYQSDSDSFLLTGHPGIPNDDITKWLFLLIGDPHDTPTNWETNDYSTSSSLIIEPSSPSTASLSDDIKSQWKNVKLPHHWQLQGYDIPIYTNTTYPFQFNPPYARRTGTWLLTPCDLGLGSSVENSMPLNTNEPGENATGLYRCKFALPSSWINITDSNDNTVSDVNDIKERYRFFLNFAGVDACLSVWLDGVFIGYSQDSCLPVEFDITDVCINYLHLNEVSKSATTANSTNNSSTSRDIQHTLAVKVSRWCDGSYLEDQDKWWLSGIYREVSITRRPIAFISDYEFHSSLIYNKNNNDADDDDDDDSNDDVNAKEALVSISILAEGIKYKRNITTNENNSNTHAVRIEIWRDIKRDVNPEIILYSEFDDRNQLPRKTYADQYISKNNKVEADIDIFPTYNPGTCTVDSVLINPSLWTAENPFLYTLVISLYENIHDAKLDQHEIHSVSHRIGIRMVDIGGPLNLLRINEIPITIAGINRHEFHCEAGRAVSKKSMREDAILLKKLNFNAVRSSHYPQHPYWLEVCDEIGLYVIDEANIETHGFQTLGQPVGYLADLTQWRSAFLSRVIRMYERDKNHPCIIGWSLGNESGYGRTTDLMADWLRKRDPYRFVQYESGGARTSATDIICPMYLRPTWCEEQAMSDHKKRPVILCEYAHAMGNSGGCLVEYWKRFRDPKFPRIQGGFIWDFADQGLLLPHKKGYGYGGDFGDFPNTKQFCCNGIVSANRKNIFPSAYEAAYLQSPTEITLLVVSSKIKSSITTTEQFNNYNNNNNIDSIDNKYELIISNRRSFRSLDDLNIKITLCYHFKTINSLIKFHSYEINCTNIEPNSFKSIEIDNYINECIISNKTYETSSMNECYLINSKDIIISEEAWLDVIVTTKPNMYDWCKDSSYEIMHSSLICKSFLYKFENSINILQDNLLNNNNTNNNINYNSNNNNDSINGMKDILVNEVMIKNNVIIDDKNVCIHWTDGSYVKIGKQCGRIITWIDKHNKELISTPIDVCFYRAATDNDRGGADFSYYSKWMECGLNKLVRKPQDSSIVSIYQSEDKSIIKVTTTWVLESNCGVDIPVKIPCTAILFDGSIDISFTIDLLLCINTPPLPRFGIYWSLPNEYEDVKWFGLGPHEGYDDRRSALYLDVFKKNIDNDLHTPYVYPQENGRRIEPRWIIFEQTTTNKGLIIIPNNNSNNNNSNNNNNNNNKDNSNTSIEFDNTLMNDNLISISTNHINNQINNDNFISSYGFTTSRYSLETIDNCTHDYELNKDEDDKIYVHIDSYMMGIGGYDSWTPNVEKKYILQKNNKYILNNNNDNNNKQIIETNIKIIPY